ncbi:MAG: hypothetical protein ACRKGH_03150 [Dehalogenimonas sp.]
MNWSGKSILFVALNFFFMGWLAAILEMLLRLLRGEDPLALFGILVADIAFVVVGIALMVLNKSYHIAAVNRVLPIIAFIGLTAVALSNVSNATLWAGAVLSAALIIVLVTTVIMTLIKR